jgi:ATP-dependent DNA helicase DinG
LSELAEIFSREGPIASSHPRWEPRPAQLEMALAVERTIERGGVLLAEAGTGTGKTLAYLLPSILSGMRTVVSTGTRNLQEQIFFKDLAFIGEALETDVDAAYLKGQDNYLCRRRLHTFSRSPKSLAHPAKGVERLVAWGEETASGDRMELDSLADDDPLWREVCSTRETRIGQRCPFFDSCHVTRARKQAMRASVIVVNHHLYFADCATRERGGTLLPEHDVLILDEAHLVEDIATEFFSVQVPFGRVLRLLDDTRATLDATGPEDDRDAARRGATIEKSRALTRALFGLFRDRTPGRSALEPRALDEDCRSSYHRLDSTLEALQRSLEAHRGQDAVIDQLADRHISLRADLSTILDSRQPGQVHWVDRRPRSTVLGCSPIDVSERLRESVFFRVPAVVLTSATLSTGGDFDYLESRLGIDFDSEEISLPAPFDYDSQACLYVPREIDDPRSGAFVDQAAKEAAALIEVTGGGALVLCTSLRNMRGVYERLEGATPGPLLVQGSAPKSVLLERFVADRGSVLVATTSFWQGVDLPGDALRLVVIDKLPFDPPGDPITAARLDHIAKHDGRPFVDYQLPRAALALKQGFGRLIRSRRDRGVVAVLDRRLRSRGYARTFFASLPSCPVTDEINAVDGWWKRGARSKTARTGG